MHIPARSLIGVFGVILSLASSAGVARAAEKEAGPIWNMADAQNKCPRVCAPPTRWNGQWRTTIPGKMSTCDCDEPQVMSKEAGPIWNQADAQNKCPRVCAPTAWNGQWRTTVPNKMSTCDCLVAEAPPPPPPPPPAQNVTSREAGPIWNMADAQNKCPRVCAPPTKWNGQWRTTIPGKMSTCDCAQPMVESRNAGPIWNQADAQNKCVRVCAPPARWNGQWRTTVQGKMSTCDCELP